MLLAGCVMRPVSLEGEPLPVEPRIRPSSDPFVENPRFCFTGIENACRRLPIEC